LLTKILDKLFVGKKPPEEIKVIAKFKELNNLILKKLRMMKIPRVINEYNKKIFRDCFKVSNLSNEIKFVKDFLKL